MFRFFTTIIRELIYVRCKIIIINNQLKHVVYRICSV